MKFASTACAITRTNAVGFCSVVIDEEGKIVTETYPISNAREESAKRNRFLIKPEELMRGERYARGKDLEVVGFYHSHPDSPAVPSQYDLEHAWPTYSYIIVSTTRGPGERSVFVGAGAGSIAV